MYASRRQCVLNAIAAVAICAATVAWPEDSGRAFAQSATTLGDFAGRWVLNAELSDTPDKMGQRGGPGGQSGRRGGGGGGIGGTGIGIGGMGGGRGGMGAGSGQGERDAAARMQRIVRAELAVLSPLLVTVDGPQLTFTATDGRVETLVTGGKKQPGLTGDGSTETRTTFQNGRLVIEKRYDEGIKSIRTCTIEPAGLTPRRLVIVVKVEVPRMQGQPEQMRVYDVDAQPPKRP